MVGSRSISSRSKRLLPVQKTPASHLGANPIPTLRRAFILVVSHTIQIVWFKRDLRTLDHTALSNACKRGPVLPLFLVERQMLRAPDCSSLHWNFVSEALNELKFTRKMGLPSSFCMKMLFQLSLTCCRLGKSSFTATKKQETPFPSRETVTCEIGRESKVSN